MRKHPGGLVPELDWPLAGKPSVRIQKTTGQETGPVWRSCRRPGQLWVWGHVAETEAGADGGARGPRREPGWPPWVTLEPLLLPTPQLQVPILVAPRPEHSPLGSQPGEGPCVLRPQRLALCPSPSRCGSLSRGPKAGMSWVLVLATNLSLSVLFFFLFSMSVASSCFSVFHFLKGRSGNRVSTPGFSLSSGPAACSSSQGWLQQCCPRAWLMLGPSVCLSAYWCLSG